MHVVGVTGPIGSGKSTVAELLKRKGALVIDADEIAHRVIEPDQPAWRQIVSRFGDGILSPDSSIDRRRLGAIVFDRPEELEFLNRAIHPRVIEEIKRRLESIEKEYGDGKVAVLDVPLLFEAGIDTMCDTTVVVTASRDIRRKRIQNQGLSRQEAESRIDAQKGKEAYEKMADIVIPNDGPVTELQERVDDLWDRIKAGNPR